jgi:hypothetical protein
MFSCLNVCIALVLFYCPRILEGERRGPRLGGDRDEYRRAEKKEGPTGDYRPQFRGVGRGGMSEQQPQ